MRFSGIWLAALFAVVAVSVAAGDAASGPDEEEDTSGIPLTAEDIPARIARAEVGEWCLYRTAGGDRLRLTITDKWQENGETQLLILNERIPRKRGKRTVRTEDRVRLKDAVEDQRRLEKEDTVVRGETLMQGQRISVVVVTYMERGRPARRSMFSDQIPVYGLVKGVTISGNTQRNSLTLLDYGYAEEAID